MPIIVSVSAPVLVLFGSNPDLWTSPTFNYISYLEEYYPYHFLIRCTSLKEIISLLIIALIGLISFLLTGKSARFLLVSLIASCIIYTLGIIAPEFIQSNVLINLHLLRESTFIHLLAAVAVMSLATSWFFDTDRFKIINASIVAAALGVTYPDIRVLLVLFLACLLAESKLNLFRRRIPSSVLDLSPALRFAAIIWIVVHTARMHSVIDMYNVKERAWIDEWKAIATWARANTSPQSVFLVPLGNWNKATSPEEIGGSPGGDRVFVPVEGDEARL